VAEIGQEALFLIATLPLVLYLVSQAHTGMPACRHTSTSGAGSGP